MSNLVLPTGSRRTGRRRQRRSFSGTTRWWSWWWSITCRSITRWWRSSIATNVRVHKLFDVFIIRFSLDVYLDAVLIKVKAMRLELPFICARTSRELLLIDFFLTFLTAPLNSVQVDMKHRHRKETWNGVRPVATFGRANIYRERYIDRFRRERKQWIDVSSTQSS